MKQSLPECLLGGKTEANLEVCPSHVPELQRLGGRSHALIVKLLPTLNSPSVLRNAASDEGSSWLGLAVTLDKSCQDHRELQLAARHSLCVAVGVCEYLSIKRRDRPASM